jgi:hypothetical protein
VDQGLLREENAIHFIVHAIGMVVVGGTHGLLGHLALIHVTRGLVVLWERLHGGNDTQNVHWVQFLVGSISSDIFLLASDRKVQLFKWSYPFCPTHFKILDGAHKASNC